MESPVAFKKRKAVRRPNGHGDRDAGQDTAIPDEISKPQIEDDSAAVSHLNGIARHRVSYNSRRGGIGFSSSAASRSDPDMPSSELVRHRPQPDAITKAANRFVGSTGQSFAAEDKHMAAYIDSRLADIAPPTEHQTVRTVEEGPLRSEIKSHEASRNTVTRYHGTQIQVEEVDVPRPVKVKAPALDIQRIPIEKPARRRRWRRPPSPTPTQPANSANTGDAQAKPTAPTPPVPSAHRPRRKRHVRTEDDLARDALVEQFLSENRLENVYDDPRARATAAAGAGAVPDDGATRVGHDKDADTRLAEEFRREFLAEAEQRRQLKRARQPAASAGGKTGADEPKGPKLGGSRQQRAAMHAAQRAAAANPT